MTRHKRKKRQQRPKASRQRQNAPAPKANNTPESVDLPALVQRAHDDPSSLSHDDVMQLQRTVGNQAVLKMMQGSAKADGVDGADADIEIQRAYTPGVVTAKTHLRDRNNDNTVAATDKIGGNLKTNKEIMYDPAVSQTVNDTTWTRAVPKTPKQWAPPGDENTTEGGFIRNEKVRAKNYPTQVRVKAGERTVTGTQKWVAGRGEFIELGPVWANTDDVVAIGRYGLITYKGDYSDFGTPMDEEQSAFYHQPDAYDMYENKMKQILIDAAKAQGRIDADALIPVLATAANARALIHPLRIAIEGANNTENTRIAEWREQVYQRTREGADHLVGALAHWRSTIYPADESKVTIDMVDIKGSDLHDVGLGAVQVTYSKPNGFDQKPSDAHSMFPGQQTVSVFIKPEDRSIEKAMLGDQDDSLANKVNELAGLDPANAIATIKMKTNQTYGTIMETVQGSVAQGGGDPGTQAMTEAIAFAMLAGMQDLHYDNVLWNNGKPHFIDADNALNADSIGKGKVQSGFSNKSRAKTTTDTDAINNNPHASNSEIVGAMLENSVPFENAVRAAFSGKSGRVVPIATGQWTSVFKRKSYIVAPDGSPTDDPQTARTRWGVANGWANKVDHGGENRGLVGEAGTSSNGRFYDRAAEAAQIKADLDKGQVPFYHYDYSTGHVSHNGVVIWHGQSVEDAIAILHEKFNPDEVDL